MDTTEVVDDILAHYGAKGMKWGIRKRRENIAVSRAGQSARKAELTKGGRSQFRIGHRPRDYGDVRRANKAGRAAAKTKKAEIKSANAKAKAAENKTRAKGKAALEKQKAAAKATKKAEKAVKREKTKAAWDAYEKRQEDAKFEQTVKSPEFKARVHNETVNIMNNYRVPQINRKYAPYLVDGTLKNPNSPVTKQYHDEVMNAYVEEANKHISTITNRTATKHLVAVRREPDEWAAFRGEDPSKEFGFDIQVEDIEHADDVLYTVAGTLDSQGLAVDFKIVPNTLTQGALFVDDILAHSGVKGMKWGVRRKATVGAQEVIVSDKRIGKGIKTKGGKGHPASSEAVSARKIGQVGKKSGLSSLSNKQLQEYNQRLNLEQQAKRLAYQDQSAAKRFIKTVTFRKGPGAAETALKSNYARKKIASGVAALAIAA